MSRATGLVSWGLLALAVLWGLFLSTRTFGKAAPPAWLLDLHRYLGGLAVAFVGVHLGAIVADNFVYFGWSEILVPMQSTYRPGAVAWGIVAFYLLLAVELTSLFQRQLPRRWWKRVHYLSFALYAVATVHLYTAGTDTNNALVRAVPIVVTGAILFLTFVRIFTPTKDPRARVPAPEAPAPEATATEARRPRAGGQSPPPRSPSPPAPRPYADPATPAAPGSRRASG